MTMNRPCLLLATALLVVGCAETPTRFDVPPARVARSAVDPTLPPPVDADSEAEDEPTRPGEVSVAAAGGGLQRLTPPPRSRESLQTMDWSGRFPSSDSVTAAVEAMPLRDFINYAYTDVLKASYVIADGVPGLDEPVTMNLQQPVSSRAFFRLVSEILDSRKITTTFRDGVFYLHTADPAGKGNVAIGLGRRAQDVPNTAGRIMQVVPLRYGLNVGIERTILDLVNVQVKPDPQQTALFITGDREAILRALDVVALLDQPTSRAREVGLVNIDFVSSRQLAEQLVTLLENEGIQAALGRGDGRNVSLVALEQIGALVVFAASPDLLQRVNYWIKQLDRPQQGPDERYFIYHPRHARASDLGESLAPLLGGETGAQLGLGNLSRDTRSALGGTVLAPTGASGTARTRVVTNPEEGTTTTATVSNQGASGQFVNQDNVLRRDTPAGSTAPVTTVAVRGENVTLSVDSRSNSLIFYTTGQRYQALLPMIRRLDVPPKQILLEATIAEVSLTGEFAYGVEFAFADGKWSGGTLGGLGLPDGGFALNYFDSITDQVRLKLSASNSLVNVLSNPTLVVRDGVEAQISVGNDVPTVGATASDPITSDRQVTQVLYRKTGLELRVRPTINAQGLVVMEITQSISNQVTGSAAVEGAPTFFERKVTTEVVARSGQSILLAGLISERDNDTTAGVPGVRKVPGLGWLFRSDTKSSEKTELVVLITPRVIDDPSEWGQIRVGLQDAFEHLRLPPETAPSAPAAAGCPDADVDGVCDGYDRCARTPAGARVNASGCEVGEFVLPGVTFAPASATLTEADEAALEPLVATLRERSQVRAEIRGHADETGDREANELLSRQRAEAVKAFLVRRGLEADRFTTAAYGELAPVASNATETGRAANRRVTVLLRNPPERWSTGP